MHQVVLSVGFGQKTHLLDWEIAHEKIKSSATRILELKVAKHCLKLPVSHFIPCAHLAVHTIKTDCDLQENVSYSPFYSMTLVHTICRSHP